MGRLAEIENRVIPYLKPLMRLHPRVYRATGGRIGRRVPGLPPLLILDHIGAKSGIERSSVIGYVADGENILLVASQGGNPKNPAWFHNLKANPDARIQIGRELREVQARVAGPGEREELWAKASSAWPVFQRYQEQTDRVIPILVLEPR